MKCRDHTTIWSGKFMATNPILDVRSDKMWSEREKIKSEI